MICFCYNDLNISVAFGFYAVAVKREIKENAKRSLAPNYLGAATGSEWEESVKNGLQQGLTLIIYSKTLKAQQQQRSFQGYTSHSRT